MPDHGAEAGIVDVVPRPRKVSPVRIVDAHHHLWIPERRDPDLGYGWLRDVGAPKPFGDPTPIQRDYEWPEFAAESGAHALAGSVHVQTDNAVDPVAETAWVQSVFDATGLDHAIVGLADLASEGLPDLLDAHARHRAFRGVRQILSRLDDDPARSFAPRHLLRDPAWRAGYASLAARGLSFDLQLYPEQMTEAAEFLADHPDVPVIVDHAGSPHDRTEAGLALWRDGTARLAALGDRVSIKLSGFGMFAPGWTADSVRPLVAHLLERFGPARTMWGSNFPVDSLMASYDHGIEAIAACLDGLGEADRDSVMGGTARRVYRLGES